MTGRVRIEKRLEPVQGFNVGPFGAAFELWDVWSGAKRLYSGSDGEKAQRVADAERRRFARDGLTIKRAPYMPAIKRAGRVEVRRADFMAEVASYTRQRGLQWFVLIWNRNPARDGWRLDHERDFPTRRAGFRFVREQLEASK